MTAVNNDFLSRAALWLAKADVRKTANEADRSM